MRLRTVKCTRIFGAALCLCVTTLSLQFHTASASAQTTISCLKAPVAATGGPSTNYYDISENTCGFQSPSNITIQGATGDFDSDQWTFEGRMDKRFSMGHHWIEPQVKVRADNLVAGEDLELGRLSIGPKIGTIWQEDGRAIASISPEAHVMGIWDFTNGGNFLVSTGAVFSSADTGLNLGGGLDVTLVNGLLLTFGGDYYVYNSDLHGWSLRGGIGSPLAALGLANFSPSGLVKLDIGATQEGLDTKARFTLPLGETE